MNRNDIEVYDNGDQSVGLSPLKIMTVSLNGECLELMKEQGTLTEFRHKLVDLISEYFAPETSYGSVMLEDFEHAGVEEE